MSTVESKPATTTRFVGGRFEVRTEAAPAPGPDEALMKVEAAGICGTDLHITDPADDVYQPETEVLGHEVSGVIVDGPPLLVGTRAVLDPNLFCLACQPCLRGLFTQCRNLGGIGITRAGGFADFVAAPIDRVVPIPDALDPETAALAEPLACVLYGLGRVPRLEPGGHATVLGAGPIGAIFAVVLERGLGRKVTVSEPSEVRRSHIEPRIGGQVVAPEELSEEPEPELVVDTTGFLFESAVRIVRPGGVILSFGLEDRGGASAQVRFTMKELTAVASFASYAALGPALELLERGLLTKEDVVTSVRPLGDIAAAFDEARSAQGVKVVLRPSAG